LRRIYNAYIPFYHSEAVARKNKRICTYDVFEIYFRLSIPSGYLPESEMDAILALAPDEAGFALALMRLNHDDAIPKFLDLLDSVGVYQISTQFIGNVVTALINNADLFPPGEDSLLSFRTPMRLHRILHQLFNRFENSEPRFEILYQAITKAENSLYILVHELNEQSREHLENEDTHVPVESRDFTPEQLAIMKKLTVEKIVEWANTGRLVEHPQLITILYAWKDWGNEEECKSYVMTITANDPGLVTFLNKALQKPIKEAIEKEAVNPEWRGDLHYINDFISAETLVPHAVTLFEDDYFVKLSEADQLALLIFLDLMRPNTVKVFPNALT
jgi:predicted KAP-like P-loop ATPase